MTKTPRIALTLSLFALLASTLIAAPATAAPQRPAKKVSSLESSVLVALNATRAKHGLAPLRFSRSLTHAAHSHSHSMGSRGFFAHDSADGSPFWKRIKRFYGVGRASTWSVGENLVWASPELDAAGAMRMWMASPSHRKNILTARWREIGISAVQVSAAPGVFAGSAATIITTDFGVRR